MLMRIFWGLLFFASSVAFGQTYDASWYRPQSTHVKIGVVEDGVYRLSGADLTKLGLDLTSIQNQSFKLIENGKEIPLWVQSAGATLGATDFIEFMGKRNTGEDEAWAYDEPASQSGTYYSLFSDTTYYWLTWGGTDGKRYQITSPTQFSQGATAINKVTQSTRTESETTYYSGDGDAQTSNPLYTRGEGFYHTSFLNSSSAASEYAYSFSLPNGTNAATDSLRIEAKLSTLNNTTHRIALQVNVKDGTSTLYKEYDVEEWNEWAFRTLTATIPQALLPSATQLQIKLVSYNPFNESRPQVLLDYMNVDFVRSAIAQTQSLRFTAQADGRFTYNLSGFSAGDVVVLQPETQKRFTVATTNGSVAFSDENTKNARYWGFQTSSVKKAVRIVLDKPSDLTSVANAADYVILTTALLKPSAQDLAQYRQTKNGFTTVIVDIQDVFDQFDYGRPTPVAIQRFVKAAMGWTKKPEFLMIWGDAIYPDRKQARQAWDVPSYGRPSSDGWFGMKVNGNQDWTESLAIGRISLRKNEESANLYLPKLKQYEAAPKSAWNKGALAMAGGVNQYEQTELKRHLNRWQSKLHDTPIGADTLLFAKVNLSAPLDASLVDSLQSKIAQGVGLVTYFGHSSAFSWEVITRPAQQWNNLPKLPVVLSLGCTTGAFADSRFEGTSIPVFGEDLVFKSSNGAIAHWGGSGSSYIGPTALMMDQVTNTIAADTVRTLGEIFRIGKAKYVRSIEQNIGGQLSAKQNSFELLHILEYNLLGDPATFLSMPTKPNLMIEAKDLTINPVTPTVSDPFVSVKVNLNNLGLVPDKPTQLTLTHYHPDGTSTPYTETVEPFKLHTTITFKVQIGSGDVGSNRVQVVADAGNDVAEENESDNLATKSFNVFSNGVFLVSPIPFAALPTQDPTLIVTSQSKIATEKSYYFEMDSTAAFNSGLIKRYQTTTKAIQISWKPGLTLLAGQTYYWRARIDEPNQPENWQTSSFTYRPDLAPGTIDFKQDFVGIETNPMLSFQNQHWAFTKQRVTVKTTSTRGAGVYNGQIEINGETLERGTIGYGLAIIDKLTGKTKTITSKVPYTNTRAIDPITDWRNFKALINAANDGDHIFLRIRAAGSTQGTVIPDSIKQYLRGVGSKAIDNLTFADLWVFYTQKGMPETMVEQGTSNPVADIELSKDLYFNVEQGQMTTRLIGPATNWSALWWTSDIPPNSSTRRITFDVEAPDGTTLLDQLTITSEQPQIDLTSISAKQYPYLRLRGTFKDELHEVTPQLTSYHLAFDAVPELALIPESYTFNADTLAEAQTLQTQVKLKNLSPQKTGKVKFFYYLTNDLNQTSLVATDSLMVVDGLSEVTLNKTFPTLGLGGKNQLQLNMVQPDFSEVITFNNTLLKPFFVRTDKLAPTFTITVDGTALTHDAQPVVNPDSPKYPFVSAKPTIEIVLSDENQYRLLDNIGLFTLKLNNQVVNLAGANVTFVPATLGNNKAKLIFKPDLSGTDGTYTLNLTVKDVAGNAGTPYQVHFRIQQAVEIESLYPYPNPMTQQTTFAFRVRGADTAQIQDLRVRIFTLAGRLVKEFDLVKDADQLTTGALRVDWNKFRWTGDDANGDALPTGVYLYRVIFKTTEGGQQVNNESGVEKIAIIR